MESLQELLLTLIIVAFATTTHLIQAQPDPKEFINLDCGLHLTLSPYTEPLTTLTYISDANFTHGGRTGRVQKDLEEAYKPLTVLRYFPDGIRNCYNLRVTPSKKYIIKALFLYGNYDGLNNGPIFDLYLGPNMWKTVDLETTSSSLTEEIIHSTKSSSLQICLVKTGKTTPIISALELRPLREDTYITTNRSLKLVRRYYASDFFGPLIRYPLDVYDREWKPIRMLNLNFVKTSLSVNSSTTYELPQEVMSKAIINKTGTEELSFFWYGDNPEDQAFIYLHFAEIQTLKGNDTREFDIIWRGNDGNITSSAYRPPKLQLETLYNTSPVKCWSTSCRVELVRTQSSTLPPMINALEAYMSIEFPDAETNPEDVAALKNIQTTYGLNKISWQGDPCLPEQLKWNGVECSYTNKSISPRIISLDLSANRLSGSIAPSFQNLTELQKLDLSNNSLSGGVPEFLANIKSLLTINLSWNNLKGRIPKALLDREKNGLKLIITQGNPQLCFDKCKNSNTRFLVPVVASIASIIVIVVVLVLIFLAKRKRMLKVRCKPQIPNSVILTKKRRFTYSEVEAVTNNFERVLGEGGFGVVYHGSLNDTEHVAVKLLSETSTQGYKQFKAEVELLLRVHHTNLVSLVGYCNEEDHMALIYEYASNGDLKQHLSGELGGSALNWASRLRIATETAQGLEYLHIGCQPQMIHRDVKTSNILLNKNYQAKLADFGLSRSFPIGDEIQVSTNVVGTPGYLDPEYYRTNWLTEKSDVYSLGIVLLEMITNQPVIQQSREKPHIVEWVGLMLTKGDVENIIDPNLNGDYDSGSAWRAIKLAMSCVNPSSSGRPNMSQVVSELKECLVYENARKLGKSDIDSKISVEPNT